MTVDPLSALGLGIEAVKQIRKLVESKVTIEPGSFVSTTSSWDTVKPVILSNKTEKPLFDIQVVLWANGEKPGVEIAIEDQEEGHQEGIGDISLNTDSFAIEGKANGKYFKLLQISYLALNSCRRVFITPKSATSINLKIVKFSTRPSTFARKKDSVAIPFIPPFNMEVMSVSFLLKRSK